MVSNVLSYFKPTPLQLNDIKLFDRGTTSNTFRRRIKYRTVLRNTFFMK